MFCSLSGLPQNTLLTKLRLRHIYVAVAKFDPLFTRGTDLPAQSSLSNNSGAVGLYTARALQKMFAVQKIRDKFELHDSEGRQSEDGDLKPEDLCKTAASALCLLKSKR